MSSPLNFFNMVVFPALSSPKISKRISFSRSLVFLIIFKSPIFYKRNTKKINLNASMTVNYQSILPNPFILPSLIPFHHRATTFPSFLLSNSVVLMKFKFNQFSLSNCYPNDSKHSISFPTTLQMNLVSILLHPPNHPQWSIHSYHCDIL